MLVGAMLFSPHAARVPVKSELRPMTRQADAEPALVPSVTITTEFFLPPNVAYDNLIHQAAAHHDVDPSLVRAVIRAESGFDAQAVSTAGAQGLMQLMPALSAELGVTDPFDPRQNIFAGVRYLRWLLDRHGGNESLALASYNAGPGAVAEYGGVPPFRETQHYVRTISRWLAKERGVVMQTPPELAPEER